MASSCARLVEAPRLSRLAQESSPSVFVGTTQVKLQVVLRGRVFLGQERQGLMFPQPQVSSFNWSGTFKPRRCLGVRKSASDNYFAS